MSGPAQGNVYALNAVTALRSYTAEFRYYSAAPIDAEGALSFSEGIHELMDVCMSFNRRRPELFDPFVTAGKPNGIGLGLTLARRIAEEHGGSVWLEESSREGTEFTLSLTKNRSFVRGAEEWHIGFEAARRAQNRQFTH